MNVRSLLEEMGYNLRNDGKYFRSKPLYRASDNPTSLRINRETGYFNDYSANIHGTLNQLVMLTFGLSTIKEAEKWVDKKGGYETPRKKYKLSIDMPIYYEESCLDRLLPSYKYYTEKKNPISIDTLSFFRGGVATNGKMLSRFVFPIFSEEGKIHGFAGRDVTDSKDIKWKLIGKKYEWCYPAFFNREIVEEKREIILVESIGDMLALWEAGIKNVWVTFGINLSTKLLAKIVKANPKKVFICLNNDKEDQSVGNAAAIRMLKKLSGFFDKEDVEIKLPTNGDFGEMTTEEIENWYNG